MTDLVVEGLNHFYGSVQSLDHINLTCRRGVMTCLLGPSGCGKSTLLRCIGGYEQPQSGSVSLADQHLVCERNSLPPEKRHVGMVFQDCALFPHLSVWQNVAFGLRKLPRSERKRLALAALDRFHLADLADRYPHTCSQ